MSEIESELTLQQKLSLETAKISWKELELFFAKGSLLQVSPGKDLVKVAEQIALNQAKDIEELILAKDIEFVTSEWAKNNCSNNPSLWAVVVAPYVLCQLA